MLPLLIQAIKAYFNVSKANIKDTGTTYDIIMVNCPIKQFSHQFTVIADTYFGADRYTHVAIHKQDLYIIFQ